MKIYFDGVDFVSRTGPNSFAHRLAVALGERGHIIADEDDYDVGLVFIQPTRATWERPDIPTVVRLDGFWSKPEQVRDGMNDGICAGLTRASAVIFQSEFDKNFMRAVYGPTWHPELDIHVIRNGAPIPGSVRKSYAEIASLRDSYDILMVMSANWHPQKRFGEGFRLYRRIKESNSGKRCGLIVLGSNPPVSMFKGDRDVMFTNNVSHDVCDAVYDACDWMIHPAWADHCPNTVVEALARGCNVICAGSGGTPELVSDVRGGIIVKDSEFGYAPFDYDKPPSWIGVDDFDCELPKLPSPDVSKIDINRVAEMYEKVLESACRLTQECLLPLRERTGYAIVWLPNAF